jgi:cell division GTPase FtsZ
MSTYHDETTSPTRVKVIGVGGGGCHAINTMIHAGVEGVEFIAVHTDEQALRSSLALTKLRLRGRLTNERRLEPPPRCGAGQRWRISTALQSRRRAPIWFL